MNFFSNLCFFHSNVFTDSQNSGGIFWGMKMSILAILWSKFQYMTSDQFWVMPSCAGLHLYGHLNRMAVEEVVYEFTPPFVFVQF